MINLNIHRLLLLFSILLFLVQSIIVFEHDASAAPTKIFYCADGEFGAPTNRATISKADLNGSNVTLVRTSTSDNRGGVCWIP